MHSRTHGMIDTEASSTCTRYAERDTRDKPEPKYLLLLWRCWRENWDVANRVDCAPRQKAKYDETSKDHPLV